MTPQTGCYVEKIRQNNCWVHGGKMKLGTLKRIDLREYWKHEALNFTKWLSEPENIALLSDEVGIGIVDTQTEASVGRFSVDILAKEENTDRKVIIENQLETTDHSHLGQLITSRCKTHIQIETLFYDFTSKNTSFLALVC